MNVRALYVNHVVIRFDHVASTVDSDVFVRTPIPGRGDILEYESIFRRSIPFECVERRLTEDVAEKFGPEILRLLHMGRHPVLHVGVSRWHGAPFFMTFGHGFLVRLARAGRGMERAFPSPKAGDVLSWSFSPRFLRVLTKYGFSLEMA